MEFRIDIHVYHHDRGGEIFAELLKRLEEYMSEFSDRLDKLEATFTNTEAAQDAAIQRVHDDVTTFNSTITALNDEIALLKDQIAQGANDPALLQRLDDLETRAEKMQAN